MEQPDNIWSAVGQRVLALFTTAITLFVGALAVAVGYFAMYVGATGLAGGDGSLLAAGAILFGIPFALGGILVLRKTVLALFFVAGLLDPESDELDSGGGGAMGPGGVDDF